mgnify:CR=1 FL=1
MLKKMMIIVGLVKVKCFISLVGILIKTSSMNILKSSVVIFLLLPLNLSGSYFAHLIIGKWSNSLNDECWSSIIEFKINGEKVETINACKTSKGNIIKTSLKSTWSIDGNHLTTTLYEWSPLIPIPPSVTIPLTETHTILTLNKDKLKIGENNFQHKGTYFRVK